MFLCFLNVTEVMVKVHVVDLKTESVASPITVRAYLNQTVTEFKQLISKVSYKIGQYIFMIACFVKYSMIIMSKT